MKNALIALSVACSSLVLAEAKTINMVQESDKFDTNYYLQGVRGFW